MTDNSFLRISLVIFCALFIALLAFAKRGAPPQVSSVHYNGVVYSTISLPETMGIVEARDDTTGKKLWERRIYSVVVMPAIEADVQWVFITSMRLEGDSLLITNERGKRFRLDLGTRKVQELPP